MGDQLHYCKKCGRIVQAFIDRNETCDYCKEPIYPIPDKFLEENLKIAMKNEFKEQFFEEYIKSSPEFDEQANAGMEEWLADSMREVHASIAQAKAQNNTPSCPSCGSANLSKISSVKKAMKVGIFGVFGAGDLGKTYKCNNCGVKF